MVDDLTTPPASPACPRSWFNRVAGWIIAGALAMGLLRGLQQLALAVATGTTGIPAWLDATAGAGYAIVAHGLAGLALAALVRALGNLDRPPMERPRIVEQTVEAPAPSPDQELATIRRLIGLGEWDAADERIQGLGDDRRASAMADELRGAKRAVGERWSEQLKAAREVNDPNRVLELYGQTPLVHDAEDRQRLDQELASWFLGLFHRRLRGGGVQLEIVTLAERVSESFGHTVEGASLRAALPTLRRSVGLCPRCGRPYTGTAEACPICLAGKPTAPPAAEPEPEPEPEAEEIDESPTGNGESEWFVERSGDDSRG